ncbi:MAG: protoporphyrinogen oxidase [Gemmatimonadetes bacterium]|nr:protoporphyrinogen oxidase [Gemmatimonadota bacterium]NIT68721.1 protoporphyrinogen oxidase [Gemmatimonadota bacterium]NIU53302.1 protoporphyrinogen oxidase [Gemmatimonadota bacterium]NIV25403.1 protoporphyrinogen oxidase [Gemmatimonadota bacterium]NIW77448.1 protoporphyrinogen oxidase [Gemmatimonadota bacterium]
MSVENAAEATRSGRRVAVVGGGIAGLAAAYELVSEPDDAGLSVDLYEARERLGGVIRTDYVDGYVLDAGPDAILTLKPAALELCRELGIEDEIIPTRDEDRGVALYSRGKLRPLPYGTGSSWLRKIFAYASSGVVSWRSKLRMAADLVIPRGPQADDESMADFFGRRLGHEAVDRIVDPLIAGIYSGDPDRLSIMSTFPRFPQMVARNRSILLSLLKAPQSGRSGTRTLPVFCSLRRGLAQLVEALEARLQGAAIHLNARVESLTRVGSGYELRTASGSRPSYSEVILAVPAPIAADLLGGDFPEVAARMASIRYVSSGTVFFAYRRDEVADRARGYGFLVPSREGRRINGATWITNKFEGRSPEDGFLARCFVGGDRTAEVLERDDADLIRICRDELREIAGIDADPLFGRVYRWRSSNPQYDVGHARRAEEIDAALAGVPGLFVTGSGFRGIGIPDCVKDGRETARRLLQSTPTH